MWVSSYTPQIIGGFEGEKSDRQSSLGMRNSASLLEQLDLDTVFGVRLKAMTRIAYADIKASDSNTILQGDRNTCQRTFEIDLVIFDPGLSIWQQQLCDTVGALVSYRSCLAVCSKNVGRRGSFVLYIFNKRFYGLIQNGKLLLSEWTFVTFWQSRKAFSSLLLFR